MTYDIFADEKKNEPTVIKVSSNKLLDIPLEGTATLTSREECKKEDEEGSTSECSEKKETIEVDNDFPKKDLGVGGASFVDEFLKFATDDQMSMLKRGERTLAGFWNWAYSKVKADYVKAYGSVNGGVFSDVRTLASEYFSDRVKEGTVVECDEYKVKTHKPTTTPVEKKQDKKAKRKYTKKGAVVEVAKQAVADAKAESENKYNKERSEKEIEKIKERIAILSGETIEDVSSPAKQSRMSKRFGSIFKR